MEKHYLYLGPKYKEAINAFNKYLGKNSEIIELSTKIGDFQGNHGMFIQQTEEAIIAGNELMIETLRRRQKDIDRRNHKEIQKEISDILKEMEHVDVNKQKHLNKKNYLSI